MSLPAPLAATLRLGDPSVVGHVVSDRLLLDLIAVPEERDADLVEAVRRALKSEG